VPAATQASSVLVDQGDYTYDPTSNLSWLDLTKTVGLSVNQVLGNVGTNYVAQGWHYATTGEILTLFKDGGISLPAGPGYYELDLTPADPSYADLYDSGRQLGKMLGFTFVSDEANPDSDYEEFQGMYPASSIPNGIGVGYVYLDLADLTEGVSPNVINANADQLADNMGSFLVRDGDVAVTPLPGTSILFASGLGLIGFIAWRRGKRDGVLSGSSNLSAA
jgi:hypothetical protein